MSQTMSPPDGPDELDHGPPEHRLWYFEEADDGADSRLRIDRDAAPDEWDVRAVEVLAVLDYVAATLLEVRRWIEADTVPEGLTQDHVDTLEHAHRVGERVLEVRETFTADVEAIDDTLLDAVRLSLVYLGEQHGADMTLDAADPDDVEAPRDRRRPTYVGRAS